MESFSMLDFPSVLRAYTLEENAVVWLAEHLSKSRSFDLVSQYHINFVSTLVNTAKILKRLPDQAYPGLSLGGRRNVALNLIYRAGEYATKTGRNGGINPDDVAKLWAKCDGCWYNRPDRFLRKSDEYEYLTRGGEARVYNRYETVIKTIGTNYYHNFQLLMDRIDIHNAVFPYSKLSVVGIGEGIFGNRKVIVEQKFIEGKSISRDELIKQMRQLGFLIQEGGGSKYRFINDSIIIDDLNERNVGKRDKQFYVIDCYAKINTDDSASGERWIIPEVGSVPQDLNVIESFLSWVTPMEMNMQDFLNLYSTSDNNLAPQILETGRYEGLIDVSFGKETIPCLVSRKTDNSNILLVLPKEKVEYLLYETPERIDDNAREQLVNGRMILLEGRPIAFNLSKGRIDSVIPDSKNPLLVVNDYGYNVLPSGKRAANTLRQELERKKDKLIEGIDNKHKESLLSDLGFAMSEKTDEMAAEVSDRKSRIREAYGKLNRVFDTPSLDKGITKKQ